MRANLADSNAIFIFQQKYTGRLKLSLMKNYSIDRMWMRKTKKMARKKNAASVSERENTHEQYENFQATRFVAH